MGKTSKRKLAVIEGVHVVALEQGALPAACRTWRGMLEAFGRAKPVEAAGGVPLVSRRNGRLKISRRVNKVVAGRPFAIRLVPKWFDDGFDVPGAALEILRESPTFCGFVLPSPRPRAGQRTNDVAFSIFVTSRSAVLADQVFEIGKVSKARLCTRWLKPKGLISTKLMVPEATFDRTVVRLERLIARQRRPVEVMARATGFVNDGSGAVIVWRKTFESRIISWIDVGGCY
jgi:hypothetical protein